MRIYILFIALLVANGLIAQRTFYSSGPNFLEPVHEPEISENLLSIAFVIKAKIQPDSTFKYPLVVEGISGTLYYNNGQKTFSIANVNFASGQDNHLKLFGTLSTTDIDNPNFNFVTDWSGIEFHLNATLSDARTYNTGTLYKNAGYNGGLRPRITKFTKLTSVRNAVIVINSDEPIYKISGIDVKDEHGQIVGAATSAEITTSDNKTFEVTVSPAASYNFIARKNYTIDLIYSPRNGNSSTVTYSEQRLEPIQEFKLVGKAHNFSVYDHNDTAITVQTSAKPIEMWAEIQQDNSSSIKVKGDISDDINTTFVIPSGDSKFQFGSHRITFSGKAELTGNELAQPSQAFFIEKKKPRVLRVSPSYRNGVFTVTTTFDGVLKDPNAVKLKIENRKFQMNKTDDTHYALSFSLKDILLKDIFDKNKNEVDISAEYEASSSSSTIITIPVAGISNDTLEMIARSNVRSGTKRSQIADYLRRNNFQGDINAVASTAVVEFAKDSSTRNWDAVWSALVKLAPKIVGALVLLL